MNCSPIPSDIFRLDPLTQMAIPSSEILLLNSQITTLHREVVQKERELFAAKNLLHSLRKRSRELQICKFVDAGKVTHIGRKTKEVKEGSHKIASKSDAEYKLTKYVKNLPPDQLKELVAELLNQKGE